ncbi:hypothetical protein TNCV_1456741 [Trichonephila clavipes]|nr:hypothetical protein TNCV_1456741 [Trichonephila clavipes]
MRTLVGTDVSENALRTLWLDKMPDSVKDIVIVNEEHIDKIAGMADKIVEMEPRANDVAALQRKFRSPSPHHHQRRIRSKSRGTATINKEDLLLPFQIRIEEPTANSLWIVEQPFRFPFGQEQKDTFQRLKKCLVTRFELITSNCQKFERGRIIRLNKTGRNHVDFGRVLFSEESHFQLCPEDNRRRVWRRPGLVFTIACHTGPQPGVMV